MGHTQLPLIMVVSITQKPNNRVIAEYAVKITVPMEPNGYAKYAIARIVHLDCISREEGDRPLIPDDCLPTAVPLEFDGNVVQLWSIQ